MVKVGGQYFCSPVSSPALLIRLPNSQGSEHPIAILATSENAVILVSGLDSRKIFWGKMMSQNLPCPQD